MAKKKKARPRPPAGVLTKTRPARTQPSAKQRIAEHRQARAQRARRVRFAVGSAAVLLVVIVLAVVINSRQQSEELRDELTAGSCRFDTMHDRVEPLPRGHVPPASYSVDPPAGGNHAPSAAPAGVYESGNVPPDGQLVHALEHGYIILWHQPDLSEADLDAVKDAASAFAVDTLVVPRPSLTVKVAATAWEKRLLCRDVEPARLRQFIDEYRNEGPEKVPHE